MNTINVEQLKSMKSQGADFLLINTLDEENFSDTEIPGAINIPQSRDDFTLQVQEVADDKSAPIVVYCASEECHSSTEGAKKLADEGFTNVHDFEGGAKAWQEAGESLTTS